MKGQGIHGHIGRLNIVKLSVPPNLINRLNVTPIKTLTSYSVDIDYSLYGKAEDSKYSIQICSRTSVENWHYLILRLIVIKTVWFREIIGT